MLLIPIMIHSQLFYGVRFHLRLILFQMLICILIYSIYISTYLSAGFFFFLQFCEILTLLSEKNVVFPKPNLTVPQMNSIFSIYSSLLNNHFVVCVYSVSTPPPAVHRSVVDFYMPV